MKLFIIGTVLAIVSSQPVPTNAPPGVVVVSPSADYGQSQTIAVQRVAARFEQQVSLAELSQVRGSRSDGDDALKAQCPAHAAGSKVLYVDAATTHDLRPGDFYKATILLSVYDCRTKKLVGVTRQAAVTGAKGWEDPLISAGYRSVEADTIAAIVDKAK